MVAMRVGGNRGREIVVRIGRGKEEVIDASASIATPMLESRERGVYSPTLLAQCKF